MLRPPHSTPRLRREPGGANALPTLLCSPCQGVSHRAERLHGAALSTAQQRGMCGNVIIERF